MTVVTLFLSSSKDRSIPVLVCKGTPVREIRDPLRYPIPPSSSSQTSIQLPDSSVLLSSSRPSESCKRKFILQRKFILERSLLFVYFFESCLHRIYSIRTLRIPWRFLQGGLGLKFLGLEPFFRLLFTGESGTSIKI